MTPLRRTAWAAAVALSAGLTAIVFLQGFSTTSLVDRARRGGGL